jgi:hypothetical protein
MNGCKLTLLLIALAGTAWAGEAKVDSQRVEIRLSRLQQELKLTTDQAGRVRSILLAAEELKVIDRDRYKADPKALTAAAQERGTRVDEQINEVLTEEQRPIYESLRRQDQKEPWRQMAQELEERLILTAEQMRPDGAGQRGSRGETQTREQSMRRLRDDTDKKIEAVLTDQQKKEFGKYKKERQDEMKRDFGGQNNEPRGF